ncbi:hypothetical protein F7725_004957 [Dissostichus mawsoni]|uniref:Uncharacterized protein n=1 Tax=Dissostichus mawsoni TaxID=36200 RepID=A0A7J5XKY1_DISMA|nr:hypothetical protein F7725_004957 [Dissostichus mawsoni]
MNSVVKQRQHSGSFLPEIPSKNNNKGKKSTQHSRRKQQKEFLPPGSDKSAEWDKLETLRRHLSRAEQQKTPLLDGVCDQRLFLAQFFSSPEDGWLSVQTGSGGRSRPATEARACLAEVYLQLGDPRRRGSRRISVSSRRRVKAGWIPPARALRALSSVYSRLADAPLEAEDHSEALRLLHRGHSIATEDKKLEFDALLDSDWPIRAQETTTQPNSEGNTQETLECLEKLVDICRDNGLKRSLADAFLSLGNTYFTMV